MPSGKEFFRRARQSNAARRKKARRLGVLTIFKQALELVKRDSSIYVKGGFISQSTIDRIVDTGFISNFYGEAECGVLDIKREDALDAAGGAPAVLPDPSSQEPQRKLIHIA